MTVSRWVGALALVVTAAAGCEIRDDACPPEPRDRTLCFDEQLTCEYGLGGACSPEWECTCEDGRWNCQPTECGADVPDAWTDVPTWEVAQDVWVDVNPMCPASSPSWGEACDGSVARCDYGQECCCGQCYASLVCECRAGFAEGLAWGCYYSDACMRPACEEVFPDAWQDVPPPVDVAFDAPSDGFQGCPLDPPLGAGPACQADGQRCEYGQECCCGQCAPSLVCQCQAGGWGCYNTDFCLRPGCSDVVQDVFESLDAPDVPPLEPGRCRTTADCADGMGSFCVPPGSPQTCGICFRPEGACATDADCAASAAGPVCAPSRTPCLCDPGVRECMPRCDAPGTTQACDAVTQQCDVPTGLCVPRRCQGSGDCAVNFRCIRQGDTGLCERLSCAWDPDCDDGWCVNGACHYEPGTCDFPKP